MGKGLVLLTGATGFIGKHVTEELISNGYKVRILTRSANFEPKENVEIRVVDYLKPQTLSKTGKDVDYVIHMAGVIKGRSFDTFKSGNIYTTINLLNEIKNYPVKKFIYLSSQSAAGPSNKYPLTENDIPKPISFYGLSKKIAEERIISSKVPYIILRPSVVFGEGDKETLTLFKLAKFGISISIEGGPIFNMIYVKDLAEIIVNVLEKDVINEVYFVNDGEVYSPEKLTKILKSVMGKRHVLHIKVPRPIAITFTSLYDYYSGLLHINSMLTREKMRELKQYAWLSSNEKLKKEIYKNFTPQKVAFERTYKWYKDHNWL